MTPTMPAPTVGGGVAMVFPGQGSQRAGMAHDLIMGWPELVEPFFGAAEEAVGFDLRSVCLDAPLDVLSRTEVTQPAVFAVSVATAAVLRHHGVEPHAVAGHSLGEFAALVCAGALDWQDGLRLVHARGVLMSRVGARTPGTMAAVMGLPAGTVESLCAAAGRAGAGVVEVANYNAATQTVVSGTHDAVARAGSAAESLGARVVPLRVGAPFHCRLMAAVEDEFSAVLDDCTVRAPDLPVVANATGDIVRTAAEVRQALRQQLTGPVRWVDTLMRLSADGCWTFVEVGPGRVLTGLTRSALPDARAVSTGDAKRIEALIRPPA